MRQFSRFDALRKRMHFRALQQCGCQWVQQIERRSLKEVLYITEVNLLAVCDIHDAFQRIQRSVGIALSVDQTLLLLSQPHLRTRHINPACYAIS